MANLGGGTGWWDKPRNYATVCLNVQSGRACRRREAVWAENTSHSHYRTRLTGKSTAEMARGYAKRWSGHGRFMDVRRQEGQVETRVCTGPTHAPAMVRV